MKIITNIKNLVLDRNQKVSEAIYHISSNECGVVVILDKSGKLEGYVQEGDIKKAFLTKNFNLNTKIYKIMNQNPFYVPFKSSLWEKKNILLKNKRLRAPILNEKREVKGFIYHITKKNIFYNKPKVSKKTKKILLIGGAGYIGSVLAQKLLREKYHIVIYDSFKFGKKSILKLKKYYNIEIIKGNTSDVKTLLKAAFGCDIMVHMSGIVGDQASELNPVNTIVDNYISTSVTCEIAKYLKITKYIFISSCSVYGFSKKKSYLNEKSPTKPLSLYAETKLQSEKQILNKNNKNFCPTVLRLGTVFGHSPRQRFDLFINIFTLLATTGKNINVFGGNQYRPNVHVEDVAKAIILCIKANLKLIKNQIFNVGSNNLNLKIMDVAKLISKLNKKTKVINYSTKIDNRDYKVDFSKIKKLLNFKTKYNITTGVKKLFKEIKSKKFKNQNKIIYNNYKIESKEMYN